MDNAVRNVSTFRNPLLATRNGEAVRILAIGDQEGKSPVYLAVDEAGNSQWESVSKHQIIDPSALPCSTEALRAIQKATRG